MKKDDGWDSAYAVHRFDGIVEIVQDNYTSTGMFVRVKGIANLDLLISDLKLARRCIQERQNKEPRPAA